MKTIKLANGVEMPQVGYGAMVSPADTERLVSEALGVGYRMIDTAQSYLNEEQVGNAVRKSGIPREQIFIVSKVWFGEYGYERAKVSIDESLCKLGGDYIDLMLLHQPYCDRYGAWRALEEAYKAGKLRAIGVANFYPDHLIDLAMNVDVKPMVNQVETHVFNQQIKPMEYMDELGCRIMAWGPLAEGRNGFFQNEVLAQIAAAHDKSIAQVALRWLLQRGIIIIPRSTKKERMEQNLLLDDFTLTDEEMELIKTLDTGHSLLFDHHDGDTTKMFMGWRRLEDMYKQV